MKRAAILISARDYFKPYMKWALACHDSGRFEISGFMCDDRQWLIDNTGGDPTIVEYTNINDAINASDLVISLGFWKIITKADIDRVPLGIINLHHSYKLKYRGRHCATWAIRNGEKVHGSTLHYMNEHLDDGPIIASDFCEIDGNDTAGTLFTKVNAIGLRLLDANIDRVLAGNVIEFVQPSPEVYTYRAKDMSNEISTVFIDDPKRLYDCVRALTYPGKPAPYIRVGERRIYLTLGEI